MTAPHAGQLIDGYLARLSEAAAALPKAERRELLEDMRGHIAEARARETEPETDAMILNILDRLGAPSVVVAEARERLGLQAPQAYQPGIVEIAALVLMLFFWPVGIILLWTSRAWNWRDKLIGTLLPPGGYMGFFVIGAVWSSPGQSCGGVTDAAGVMHSTCSAGPAAWQQALGTIFVVALAVLPLITLVYLAIRLRWGRHVVARLA
ncbi:MAG: hypothetical protein M3077_05375 [Candidatus Dormibacteraeota bacterium]|nr:hypothetical protein [Candidatus Dormibacteraeota bacterium]